MPQTFSFGDISEILKRRAPLEAWTSGTATETTMGEQCFLGFLLLAMRLPLIFGFLFLNPGKCMDHGHSHGALSGCGFKLTYRRKLARDTGGRRAGSQAQVTIPEPPRTPGLEPAMKNSCCTIIRRLRIFYCYLQF